MKIDFNVVLRDVYGRALQEVEGVEMTLGRACVGALMAAYQDEQALEGEKKLGRWKLAQQIVEEGGDEPSYATLDLRAEDVVLLKELVVKAFATVICAQACELLDGVRD